MPSQQQPRPIRPWHWLPIGLVGLLAATPPVFAQRKGFFSTMTKLIDDSGILPGANPEPEKALGALISSLLAFLGIIFMILIIYGGFLWMTARGAEDQISKAKKIIISATIGLTIVLSAYLISLIVVSLLTAQTQKTP